MAATFARLSQQVDQTQRELEGEISRLTANIQRLEVVQRRSKSLRSEPEVSNLIRKGHASVGFCFSPALKLMIEDHDELS